MPTSRFGLFLSSGFLIVSLTLWGMKGADAVSASDTSSMFRNVMVLAPMVRVSNLPLRLLALDYGADLVWSEEIIAQKIAKCERTVNDDLGTVEYWSKPSSEGPRQRVFYTAEREREKLVFQAGVGNSVDALAAAQTVLKDIAAFDINCGCPKSFSVQGGMGAALLKEPERIADMIRTLKRNINIPVTAKVRLLEAEKDSIALVQMLEKAGVDALTVHCRYTSQRSSTPAHQHLLSPLVAAVKIPVLGNGDVTNYHEAQAWRARSGCAGIMVARGAVENTSCFRKEGLLPVRRIVEEHVQYCMRYDESYQNIKFIYQRHFTQVVPPGGELFAAVTAARNMAEVSVAFGMEKFYTGLMADRKAKARQAAISKGLGESSGIEEREKKKAKASAWLCHECGVEFASRNAYGRHCGETGHKKA